MESHDIKIDPNFRSGCGVSKFTSWRRLEEILIAAGEIRPDERITGYKVDAQGVAYYIETRTGDE